MVYHCVSRTVNGERLFEDVDRELLRRMMWQIADFCGVHILTYAILSNHFHLLVRVPKKEPIPDSELLRRYTVMYPARGERRLAQVSAISSLLETKSPDAELWRARVTGLMGDISSYLKLLKQRFSIAFNKRHGRFGTLWSERFKSSIVEPGGALRTVAAYIDLNPVRAGLVEDPKDYRFCGYSEAVAGNPKAQAGLCWTLGERWSHAAARYRIIIFGVGANPLTTRKTISESAFQEVIRRNGRLPISTLLCCRVRHFTDSGILGSKLFVEHIAQRCNHRLTKDPPHLCFAPELEGIYAARPLRAKVIP
jgi:putative transposase